MGEEVIFKILGALIVIGAACFLWREFRTTRRMRKDYENLSEEEKRHFDETVFRQNPTVAAYARPLSARRVVLILIIGIPLAIVAIYLTHRFTGH